MNFHIIPQPNSISVKNDSTVFKLSYLANISFDSQSEKANASLLAFLKKVFELEPVGTGRESVVLAVDGNIGKSEAYILTVEENLVKITGSDSAGVFYGVQTLIQLLLQGELCLPELTINDEPQHEYRGFMLDVSRYFFSVEAVKLFLDSMALHKLNRFHIHLTDDQGWRVELYNNLPLSQIGAYRAYTNFGKTPHGGFYSKADIEEIVAYAHERFIKVVPEIESPGHIVSAIAAYPFLSCFERQLTVATNSGVHYDVLCVGKESSFDFMFSVLDEVCEMFPDKIIHIGGDEVPVVRWEVCPHCQKKMKELGLENEKQLYAYYINRIASYLEAKGFQVEMWNNPEIGGEISSSIIKQYWNSTPDGDCDETKTIDSESLAYYLDLPYGTATLENCYRHKPSCGGKKPLGLEACLWTEYVPTMKKAGYCTFPRLGAFAETAWTKEENKDYSRFLKKLSSYYKLLDTLPIDYATEKQAVPNPIRKYGYKLYFERRKLHWQGLHNIIDNNKVKKAAKQKGEK